ncbi:MAG TPA: class II aldolase/adducin family protein [Dehalococcoidia bacterium]
MDKLARGIGKAVEAERATLPTGGTGAAGSGAPQAGSTGRSFLIHGQPEGTAAWLAEGLARELATRGHTPCNALTADTNLVLNFVDLERPRSIRRRGRGTFAVTIAVGSPDTRNVLEAAYPLFPRTLGNLILYVIPGDPGCEAHFVTLEQGHYVVAYDGRDQAAFFRALYDRLMPLATARLVIDNIFTPDLPRELWRGDEVTASITRTGQRLDAMGLLPAPFPVHEYVSPRDYRHVQLLYGLGGLSYGNISARARHDPAAFWMSASGVDKGKLAQVGRDILLVTGYDTQANAMRVSHPAGVKPRRVSVDAIEHWMIYTSHPGVGAIVHVHSWWDGEIEVTELNYPCGTWELAQEVADIVRRAPDPDHAVIGLKNHGLTITGESLDEILGRIEGRIVPQVPMS